MPTIGPSNASSFASSNANGGNTAWANPGNAATDNSSYTTVNGIFGGGFSERLTAQSISDFAALADDDHVSEIVVEVKRSSTSANKLIDNEAKLIVAGVVQDDNRAIAGFWGSSDAYVTYTFSVSLTGAEVKGATFGFLLAAAYLNLGIGRVDHIRFTATYTPAVVPSNDVAENLIAFLLADAAIAALVGENVHQNQVPHEAVFPFIWLQQAGVNYEGVTDAAPGTEPDDFLFDLESVSDDVDQAAELSALVRNRLAFWRGAFGDSTVQSILVDDHEDDYLKRNENADQGIHVASLRATVSPM
jgi:hypothetical protein